jgi:hypothetical protein
MAESDGPTQAGAHTLPQKDTPLQKIKTRTSGV